MSDDLMTMFGLLPGQVPAAKEPVMIDAPVQVLGEAKFTAPTKDITPLVAGAVKRPM